MKDKNLENMMNKKNKIISNADKFNDDFFLIDFDDNSYLESSNSRLKDLSLIYNHYPENKDNFNYYLPKSELKYK